MEKKTYTSPELTEIGSINDVVHQDRLSPKADGSYDSTEKVLLTRS